MVLIPSDDANYETRIAFFDLNMIVVFENKEMIVQVRFIYVEDPGQVTKRITDQLSSPVLASVDDPREPGPSRQGQEVNEQQPLRSRQLKSGCSVQPLVDPQLDPLPAR